MTAPPRLSVVIPTKDRQAILEATVSALLPALGGLDAEVIIVNDSKTTRPNVRTMPGVSVRVIDNPGAGAASARNFGASAAGSELLLFLDNDIIVGREDLSMALKFHAEHPSAALNPDWNYPPALTEAMARTQMGRFLISAGMTRYRGWVSDLPWDSAAPFQVEKLATFFLLMRRGDFTQCGGFNESFKNQGVEDFELSKRLRAQGVPMFIDPRVCVIHNSHDKVTLDAHLDGMRISGRNRRIGVQLGMGELACRFSPMKTGAYAVMGQHLPSLAAVASAIPNVRAFDPLYRFLVNRLLAASFYTGYSSAS